MHSAAGHRPNPPGRPVRLRCFHWVVNICCNNRRGVCLPACRYPSHSRARPGELPIRFPGDRLSDFAMLTKWTCCGCAILGCPGVQLPNQAFWRELAGLVRDGVSFVTRGGSFPEGNRSENNAASASGLNAGLLAESSKDQAPRGTATPLHIAAQLGDARGLANLLQVDKRFRPPIDAGDARRYTALHCACAGSRSV